MNRYDKTVIFMMMFVITIYTVLMIVAYNNQVNKTPGPYYTWSSK